MKKQYIWDIKLETGNIEIDNQHKELFNIANNLLQAYDEGKPLKEIKKTIGFLVEFVIKHFDDEEKLLEKYKCPDMTKHKYSHEDLKRKLINLVQNLDIEGYSLDFIEKTLKFINDAIRNHIIDYDFKLAAYIREKETAN